MVLNCLGERWIFSLLKETPTGRGLWRATRRTRSSKFSNSNRPIGTNDRCVSLVARIRGFIESDMEFPSIYELPGPDRPGKRFRPSLPGYEFEFPCCEFSLVVQLNKPVSIPPVMRQIALDVRQNSWPIFMRAALALETRLLFILLNAIRKRGRVMQLACQLSPKCRRG